jgi:hypothetical protein
MLGQRWPLCKCVQCRGPKQSQERDIAKKRERRQWRREVNRGE